MFFYKWSKMTKVGKNGKISKKKTKLKDKQTQKKDNKDLLKNTEILVIHPVTHGIRVRNGHVDVLTWTIW